MDAANNTIETLTAAVVDARVDVTLTACSYSDVCQAKGEAEDVYVARLARIRGREKARDAALWKLINALIALAAAENAVAAEAKEAAWFDAQEAAPLGL
jgi:transposase